MAASLPVLFNVVDHHTDGPIIIVDGPLDLQVVQHVNQAAAAAIKARQVTIQLIRATAQEVDEVAKQEKITAIAGGTVSILGTVLGIAGGVVTVATAGAAVVPIAAAVLICGGAGVGVVGGITKGVGGYMCSKKQSTLFEQLKKTIEEDEAAHSLLGDLMKTFHEPMYENIEFAIIEACISGGIALANSIANVRGGVTLVTLLSARLPQLSKYIKNKDIQKLLGSPLVTILLPILISSLEVTIKSGVSTTDDIAIGVVGTMVDGPTKKMAFTAAKEAAQTVIHQGGDDAARALTQAAVIKAQEKAAAEAAKKLAETAVNSTAKELTKTAAESAAALAAKAVAEEAVERAVEEGAKKAAEAGLKKATEAAAVKMAKKTAAEAAKVTAKQAAKAASKEAARKTAEAIAAKEAADAAVKVAATAAAKEATQNMVKTMARVAGGVTIGLGAIMVAWDAYGMYKDCQKESLGDALRRLAVSLENTGASALASSI